PGWPNRNSGTKWIVHETPVPVIRPALVWPLCQRATSSVKKKVVTQCLATEEYSIVPVGPLRRNSEIGLRSTIWLARKYGERACGLRGVEHVDPRVGRAQRHRGAQP